MFAANKLKTLHHGNRDDCDFMEVCRKDNHWPWQGRPSQERPVRSTVTAYSPGGRPGEACEVQHTVPGPGQERSVRSTVTACSPGGGPGEACEVQHTVPGPGQERPVRYSIQSQGRARRGL